MDAQDTPDAAERRARALLADAAAAEARVCPRWCDGACGACIARMGASGALNVAAPDLARDVLSLADALRAAEARAVAAEAALRSTGDSALRITTQLGAALIERDAADARHAALAGAVREYRGAVDDACIAKGSEDAGLDAAFAAAEREDDAARAVDALLRGAPGGYVEARVVRAYLAAADASRRIAGESCDVLSDGAIDDWRARHGAASKAKVAARTALDAALLAATTTPTEGHRP